MESPVDLRYASPDSSRFLPRCVPSSRGARTIRQQAQKIMVTHWLCAFVDQDCLVKVGRSDFILASVRHPPLFRRRRSRHRLLGIARSASQTAWQPKRSLFSHIGPGIEVYFSIPKALRSYQPVLVGDMHFLLRTNPVLSQHDNPL